MKLLLENWRQFLIEVSYEQAQKSLDSKKTRRLIASEGGKTEIFKRTMLAMIPDDIEDGQKGTALLWLLRMFRRWPMFRARRFYSSGLRDPPDAWTRGDLEYFFQHQRFMKIKDLNRIKSNIALHSVVGEARPKVRAHQEKQKNLDADEGTKVLEHPDKKEWEIVLALNKGAACKLGTDKWCTAHKDLPYFDRYSKPDDPLIILKNLKTNDRYQVHYGSNQFKDKNDDEVKSEFAYELHKLISQAEVGGTPMLERYPIIKLKNWTIISSKSSDLQELSILAHRIADPEDKDFKTMERLTQWDRIDKPTIEDIFISLVKNPNTDSETLEFLFKRLHDFGFPTNANRGGSPYDFVSHKNTTYFILNEVSQSEHYGVRGWVAASEGLFKIKGGAEIYKRLAKDPKAYVREGAAKNPSASPALLRKFLEDFEGNANKPAIYIELINNLNTPPDVYNDLADKYIDKANPTHRDGNVLIQIFSQAGRIGWSSERVRNDVLVKLLNAAHAGKIELGAGGFEAARAVAKSSRGINWQPPEQTLKENKIKLRIIL